MIASFLVGMVKRYSFQQTYATGKKSRLLAYNRHEETIAQREIAFQRCAGQASIQVHYKDAMRTLHSIFLFCFSSLRALKRPSAGLMHMNWLHYAKKGKGESRTILS
jgi:hypothetical protein